MSRKGERLTTISSAKMIYSSKLRVVEPSLSAISGGVVCLVLVAYLILLSSENGLVKLVRDSHTMYLHAH